jgi:hypothetical protein
MNRSCFQAYVFNCIEMFYNTRRRHGFNNQLSPVEYEAQYLHDWRVSRELVAIQYIPKNIPE